MKNIVRKKRSEGAGDNWALTLADMMTLLLCFFVLMLGIAKVDQQKYEAVSESMAEAMKSKKPGKDKMVPSVARMQIAPQGRNLFELQLELAKLIGKETKAIELKMRPDAVAISLRGGVFFDSGDASLTSDAMRILNKIVGPLTEYHYKLTVEGHSDNIPISSAKYPSNWELSSARASSVARYFIDHGFPKKDIQVMGLADTQPEAPNEDANGNSLPDNQAKNRRVVLLVRPI